VSATFRLKHAIVRTVADDQVAGGKRDEELKPAGFEFQVRRPKGKDLKASGRAASDADAAFILAERLTPFTSIELDEMDGEDFIIIGDAVADFLPKAQPSRSGSTA
jgi:hypothetical protein